MSIICIKQVITMDSAFLCWIYIIKAIRTVVYMFSGKQTRLICTGSDYILNIVPKMFQLEKSKTYVHQLLIQTSSLYNRNLPIHLFLIGKTPFESWTILCHMIKMLKYFLSIYNLYNIKLSLYGVQKYSISYFFACHKVCINGENIQHF